MKVHSAASKAIAGLERRIGQQVQESWLRCRTQFALKQDAQRSASYVGPEELSRRRRRMGPVFEAAAMEMMNLYQLMQAPVGIMVTDAVGVIVRYIGSTGFTALAQRAGMREGAVWSEAEQGTNGMGTCLAVREPVLIRPGEHYLRQNTAFACCAAPIRDARGAVVGALNISGLNEMSWAPTLALITLAARTIESCALLEASRDAYLLRFHPFQAFVTTASEGLLAIDDSGHITGANQIALEWLRAVDPRGVIDQPIQRICGLTLDQLHQMRRNSPGHAHRLPGTELYGLLRQPASMTDAVAGQPAPLVTAGNPLARAERAALLDALESSGWNVSLAARKLKLGRKTLYRKIQRHELLRPGGPQSNKMQH